MDRINDWEIMGPWEATFGGTFEAETDFSDWLKDLHKTSIKELDIVGLHDTTTGEDRKFLAIDKALEIIDDEIWAWERTREKLGYKPEDDNAEAALAIARSRIEEFLKGGKKE